MTDENNVSMPEDPIVPPAPDAAPDVPEAPAMPEPDMSADVVPAAPEVPEPVPAPEPVAPAPAPMEPEPVAAPQPAPPAPPTAPMAPPPPPAPQAAPMPAAPAAAQGEKSKVVAGVLAILLGALGVHKFYLGYTKEGVIMLAVSLVGSFIFGLGPTVMAVIGLIEGIMYLTKTDDEFYQTYVAGNKGWF